MVLSSVQDDFFRANMFENFGDLGMNIKRMVDDFQHLSKSSLNLQSIGNIELRFSLLHVTNKLSME